MIKGKDIYEILVALMPLYVAMMLGYGSVRWWKIFTPEQCSGINRFVVVFAAPTLAFNFIASTDLYKMNWKFIGADTLQKVVIFGALSLWSTFFTKRGDGFDWTITLFSIATSPNTLLIGVPLLKSMYGDFTSSLMTQMVVMQSVIWFNFLLFLYECRAAKHFISQQYLETNQGSNIKVDSNVGSLNGREPLQAHGDVEMGEAGNLHVGVKNSASSSMTNSPSFPKSHSSSRVSNLAGVGIYSVSTREPIKTRASSLRFFNPTDFFYTSSLQNAGFEEEMLKMQEKRSWRSKSYTGEVQSTLNSESRSSRTSSASRHAVNKVAPADLDIIDTSKPVDDVAQEIATSKGAHELIDMSSSPKANGDKQHVIENENKYPLSECKKEVNIKEGTANKRMPSSLGMTMLVLLMVWRNLIRNPNTHAAFLGLVWSLISYRWKIAMPSIINGSIALLYRTGLGMAMFSLGLFMALQPKILACGKTMAAITMAIKFLVGPAVMAATSVAVGIRGVLLQVAIIQAVIPQGIVPFVFAKEYNVHAQIISTSIIFGTAIAIPIAILYFVLLGL